MVCLQTDKKNLPPNLLCDKNGIKLKHLVSVILPDRDYVKWRNYVVEVRRAIGFTPPPAYQNTLQPHWQAARYKLPQQVCLHQ